MNNIIKKYIGKSSLMMAFALMATGTAMTSCSDDTLSNINTDKTKVNELDPNAQEKYLKGVDFHYVENVADVWQFALTDEKVKTPTDFSIEENDKKE